MTLYRQLFIGTSVVFLLILAATETIYIRKTQEYLQQQLASHAQDAATSLGMSLPAALAGNDPVRAEVIVAVLFDRGYYQSIRLVDIKGETVVLKTLPAAPAEVPSWFAAVLPLQTRPGESLISNGWNQLGRVIVTSHPNFAYRQLWETLLESTAVLLLLYALALLALNAFLKRVLQPLRDIEAVAHAISDRDFRIVQTVPKPRELRSVVDAINSMSGKLRDLVEYEVSQANRFREESTRDALTGLTNRRGFEEYVNTQLEDSKNLDSGALFMLQLTDLQRYNALHGLRRGDALLQKVAAAIQPLGEGTNRVCARGNGGNFVLLAPNIDRAEASGLGTAMKDAVAAVLDGLAVESEVHFGCGAVFFAGQKVTLNALLAQSDLACLQSQSSVLREFVLQDFEFAYRSQGTHYWKKLIAEAIASARLALFSQPVISLRDPAGGLIQHEVFGRLRLESGELIPASEFIPMANRHGLTQSFDLALLQRLLGRMASGAIAGEVAVNLSLHAIHDQTFMVWLCDAMRSDHEVASRLVFEFTEFSIVQDRQGVEEFVAVARELGANFAVDNFGFHPHAFDYLQSLKPRYVKLSRAYIRDLHGNRRHQFFISSVVLITRPLEIGVIALGVEHADLLPLLTDLGVDGYQGIVSGEMTELE